MKFSSVFIFRISCFYYVRSRGHKNNQQSTQQHFKHSMDGSNWSVAFGEFWVRVNFTQKSVAC